MKKYHFLLLGITLLLLILIGYRYFQNKEEVTRYSWLENWIEKPFCSPPCWNNITPGVTTIDSASEIIHSDQRNINIEGPFIGNPVTKVKCLYWSIKDYDQKEYHLGNVCTFPDNETVRFIRLNLMDEDEKSKITLGEINNIYGDPNKLVYYYEHNACVFSVINNEYGMVIVLGLVPMKGYINANEKNRIDYLEFFPKDSMNDETWGFSLDPLGEYPWDGYGKYQCK